MKLLDEFFKLRQQIFDYFGYVEDWRVIPIDDGREYFWRIVGGDKRGDGGEVHFGETEDDIADPDEPKYSNVIYTQRFLPKWIYRGPEYTMICVDTQTDGNKFLTIFDNSKERPLK